MSHMSQSTISQWKFWQCCAAAFPQQHPTSGNVDWPPGIVLCHFLLSSPILPPCLRLWPGIFITVCACNLQRRVWLQHTCAHWCGPSSHICAECGCDWVVYGSDVPKETQEYETGYAAQWCQTYVQAAKAYRLHSRNGLYDETLEDHVVISHGWCACLNTIVRADVY